MTHQAESRDNSIPGAAAEIPSAHERQDHIDPQILGYWMSHPAFSSKDEIEKCLASIRESLAAMPNDLVFSEESYTKTFLPTVLKK